MNDTKHDQTEDREPVPDQEPVQDQEQREPNDRESGENVIDEPVLDGATEHQDTDVDPRKGLSDPALIRDIDAEKKTVNPYG